MKNNRLTNLRELLDSKRCSHILVSDSTDVLSLTGFKSSNVFLLVSKHSNLLFTDFRYQTAAQAFCKKNRDWTFTLIAQSNFDFLKKHIPRDARLGFQSECMPVDLFVKLRATLKNVAFTRLSGTIPGLSIIKTDAEVSVMRRCADIAGSGLHHTLKKIKPGMTEQEVSFLLDTTCRRMGAETMGFETIVLFGKRAALPHGVPGPAVLKKGDWMLFDFGCELAGLRSDMTRTFVYGKASSQQRKIYNIVLKAQTACRESIRGNMKALDADTLARSVIEKAGFGTKFGHGTGHGVGYRIHEAPRLGRSSKDNLVAGSVVTVEPGIYIAGFGGVRIEDMVRLTGTGSELLTTFPRELIEVGL